MKKASEIMTLDGLGLSKIARSCIERRYETTQSTIAGGRCLAYWYEKHPKERDNAPKWELELVSKLDEAGLIRHDLFPYIIPVFNLACAVCKMDSSFHPENRYLLFRADYYENFSVSEEQYAEVLKAILSIKTLEGLVILYHYGFNNGGRSRSLEETTGRFHVTRERVRQMLAKGARRLQFSDNRKIFLNITGFEDPCPHFIVPQKNTDPAMDFGELGFSIRAYNVMHRAGFRTVGDILNFPKDEWFYIRNMGRKCANSIVEVMRASGYSDFNITGSSYDSSQ
jgi:hypothetical protein